MTDFFEGVDAPPSPPFNNIAKMIDDGLRTPYSVRLGDTFIGNLLPAESLATFSDTDAIKIYLNANETVIVDVTGSSRQGYQPVEDSLLILFNDRGEIVAADDDGGPGLDSRISFTPSESGDYFFFIESVAAVLNNPVGYQATFAGIPNSPSPNFATNGNDFIIGTPENDQIDSFDGNDIIVPLSGNDIIPVLLN